MPSPRPKQPSETTPTPMLTKITWSLILAVTGLMPLTVALGSGSSAWYLDEPYHLPKLMLLAAGLTATTACWLGEVLGRKRPLRIGKALIAVATLAVLVVISTAVSPLPASALFGAIGLSTGAITWLLCMWWLFVITQYVDSPARLEQLSWAVVAGCALAALVALMGAAGIDPLHTPTTPDSVWMVGQGMGTTGNPDFTGLLLVIPAVVALGLAALARSRSLRVVAAAAAGVMCAALFITLSRAAALGVAVALAVFALTQARKILASRNAKIAIGAAAVAVVAVAVKITTVHDLVKRLHSKGGFSLASSDRIPLWKDVLAVVTRHPVFGMGPDQLALGGYQVQAHPLIVGTQRFVLQDPHSLPLMIAGVLGIPALLVALALVVMALVPGVRGLLRREPGNVLYTAWLAAFVGLCAATLVSVWTVTTMFILFTAIAVLIAPQLKRTENAMIPALILGVVAVPLLFVSMFGASRSISASREVMLSNTDNPPVHFAKAIELAPWDANTRIKYYVRKIYGLQNTISGPDAAASRSTVDGIDAELRMEITRFPQELLFYRLRYFLLRMPQGSPGYRPDLLRDALQQAAAAFPVDPEFRDALAQMQKSGQGVVPASGQ